MSFSGAPYAQSMADLIRSEGAARADAARQKGAIWGQTMASLGQIPGQVMAFRQAEQDRALAAEDRSLRRDTLTRQGEIDTLALTRGREDQARQERLRSILQSDGDLASKLAAIEREDPQLALEMEREIQEQGVRRLARVAQTVAPLRQLPLEQRAGPFHMARASLQREGIPTIGWPAVPDDAFLDSVMDASMTVQQQMALHRERRAERQAGNQQGVRRMVGEFVAQRGGQPLSAGERQTMQGMALQEGVELPESITAPPRLSFGAPEKVQIGNRTTFIRPGSDGTWYGMGGEAIDPRTVAFGPTSATRLWVRRNGKAIRVTEDQYRPGDQPLGEGGAAEPAVPRGVQDYLASMKGRGYTRAQAEGEVYRRDVWEKLRAAHPRLNAVDVQKGLDQLFPEFDMGGEPIFASPGSGTTGSGTGRGAGAGAGPVSGGPQGQPAARTATAADVRAVARQMGISEADARRRLAAQGVALVD